MMSKHTPGPWKVSSNLILTSWGEELAFMAEVDGDVASEQSANAELIASAPDMKDEIEKKNQLIADLLEACGALLREITIPTPGSIGEDRILRVIKESQTAIAKAQGNKE